MRIKKTRYNLIAIAFLIVAAPELAPAQTNIPDVNLEVTVRQQEDGKIRAGYHLMELFCFEGRCMLTTLSLNDCFKTNSGGQGFFTVMDRKTNDNPALQVMRDKNILIVQEKGDDIGGDYITTHRFGFEPSKDNGRFAKRVTSYSGGFVKNSAILQKVITINYIPLQHRSQEVRLDCAVILPGVDSIN